MIKLIPGWVEIFRNGVTALIDPEEFVMLPYTEQNKDREWWDVAREYIARVFQVPVEEVSVSEVMDLDAAMKPVIEQRQDERKKKYGQIASSQDSTQESQTPTGGGP